MLVYERIDAFQNSKGFDKIDYTLKQFIKKNQREFSNHKPIQITSYEQTDLKEYSAQVLKEQNICLDQLERDSTKEIASNIASLRQIKSTIDYERAPDFGMTKQVYKSDDLNLSYKGKNGMFR